MYVVIKDTQADDSRDGENHFFYGSLTALVDDHKIEIKDRLGKVIDTQTFFNNHFSRKKKQYYKHENLTIYRGDLNRSGRSK